MSEDIGWGADRFSFTADEVHRLNQLMDATGGSIHDTLKLFLLGTKGSQEELLRLVYIIENRTRLLKTCEALACGKLYDTFTEIK